jgi:DNA-binding MarR family transcriptional regulator
VSPSILAPPDARLILSDDALDRALETLFLAEAALWVSVDAVLEADAQGSPYTLGRGHYRAAFLIKLHPGLGVLELARLTGLSKQGASRVMGDLVKVGLVEPAESGGDARRRPVQLSQEGHAFEARISARLRGLMGKAYRAAGLEKAPAASAVLGALSAVVLREPETSR